MGNHLIELGFGISRSTLMLRTHRRSKMLNKLLTQRVFHSRLQTGRG
jgi:hypothetical protein